MCIDVTGAKEHRNFFSRFLQGDIDNGRFLGGFLDSLKQAVLFVRCGRRRDLQKKIVTIKSGDNHVLFKNVEFGAHVVNYRCRCSGGQQQRLRYFEFCLVIRQFQIFGPKIM
ncbi:MAG: hypothetical protein WCE56_10790, partial [Desulfobacterales bacterium]